MSFFSSNNNVLYYTVSSFKKSLKQISDGLANASSSIDAVSAFTESSLALMFLADLCFYKNDLGNSRQPLHNSLLSNIIGSNIVNSYLSYFDGPLTVDSLYNARMSLYGKLTSGSLIPRGFWCPGNKTDSFVSSFIVLLGDLVYYPSFTEHGILYDYASKPLLMIGAFDSLLFANDYSSLVSEPCLSFLIDIDKKSQGRK